MTDEEAPANDSDGEAGTSDTSQSSEDSSLSTGSLDISRRQFVAALATATGAGLLATSGREEWCDRSIEFELPTAGRTFWLGTDETLQGRPLHTLSLPGTHHASFSEMSSNDLPAGLITDGPVRRWTQPQSHGIKTQLADGIRYLDIRPRYVNDDGDQTPGGDETAFWGHHELSRGDSLKEAFEELRAFLERADETVSGNEFVIIKLSHLDGFEQETRREAFASFLEDTIGEFALSLPDYDPATLLNQTLSSFDGSRVAVLFEGTNPWPGVADDRERWLRDGWVDERKLDDAHEAASSHTHTETSRLGEVGYYITPSEGYIAAAVLTGWLPFSDRWLGYTDLYDAATRMARRFPCFVEEIQTDSEMNPNVITVDFYELTVVVGVCRYLSRQGLHGDRE